MRGSGFTIATGLGVVGLVLIGFETVQSMRSVAMHTLGTALTYVGLGLFVVAAVLVVVGLTENADSAASGEAAAGVDTAEASAT